MSFDPGGMQENLGYHKKDVFTLVTLRSSVRDTVIYCRLFGKSASNSKKCLCFDKVKYYMTCHVNLHVMKCHVVRKETSGCL